MTPKEKNMLMKERVEKIAECHNFILEYFKEQELDLYSVIFVLDITKHELLARQSKKLGGE